MLRFTFVCVVVAARAAHAQAPSPAAAPMVLDGSTVVAVTTFSVRSGKIARLQTSTGEIKEISSVRMNRQNVILLTPSTNALMQVTDIRLPSGTFKSEDGRSSMSVMGGRPIGFMLSANSP